MTVNVAWRMNPGSGEPAQARLVSPVGEWIRVDLSMSVCGMMAVRC
jgi:hypothetical protein